MELYPLTFEPILKERIWGGRKLHTVLGKAIPGGGTAGESWELSAVPGDVSVVKNGALQGQSLTSLLERQPREILGNAVYERFGTQFPLLIKFIDAKDDLSIQVHPSDALAKARHNCPGKTEMWYVMDADAGSRIIVGFKDNSSPEQYMAHLRNKSLGEILNQVPAQKGDVFFLATGTIHAIGAGILLAEIQQTSDITYRIYDWDRVDANGKGRELHVEQALEAMNYNVVDAQRRYGTEPNQNNNVVDCPYFTTNYLPLDGALSVAHEGESFRIYICVEGQASVEANGARYGFSAGETFLMPAAMRNFKLSGNAALLETYIA